MIDIIFEVLGGLLDQFDTSGLSWFEFAIFLAFITAIFVVVGAVVVYVLL